MGLCRRRFCVSSFLTTVLPWSWLTQVGCADVVKPPEPDLLERLAFGSCNKQNQLQTHWQTILKSDPQGWLWMGDSIYGDNASPNEKAKEYLKLALNPDYAAVLSRCFLLGTWDDHDYAENNAGAEYPHREETKKVFLDFIGEAPDSARRKRPGIYDSRDIGKPEQAVQIIMLDLRTFKPAAGESADPIGPAQWSWLETEIKRPGPVLKIIVSSIQFLTDFTVKETWAQFPEAQERLFRLLAQSPVQTIIFSGDRHLSEISQRELEDGRKVYEFTASGLTHTSDLVNANPWRVGEQIVATNYGFMQLNWDKPEGETPKLLSVVLRALSPQSGTELQKILIPIA